MNSYLKYAIAIIGALGLNFAIFSDVVSQVSNPGVQQAPGAVAANDCVKWVSTGKITTTGAPCAGAPPTGANPTATATGSAINGVATTFMRSDAAPAVSATTFGGQSVAPAGSATMQGNGAKIQASTGATTTNNCVKFDANGNTVDNGAACATQSVGANPTATASDISVAGVAATFMRSDAAPAVQKGTNAQFGVVRGDGTTVDCNGTPGICVAKINAIFPTPTRAGDIVYWNGTSWTTLAGNNSGTQVLTENSSGVPSWSSAGSGTVTSATVAGTTGNIAVSGTCTITTTGTCTVDLASARKTLSSGCAINSTALTTCADGSAGANNGTYTVPSGALWLEIELVGGGGGGAGSGTSPGNGGAGGATTFGTGPLLTSGTASGATTSAGGAGGTPSGGFMNKTGATGGNGSGLNATAGGFGCNGPFGGGGVGGAAGAGAGVAAAANSGSGGGGGGVNTTINGGGGGGCGGFLRAIIQSPAATYTYAIGAGGTAGTAGTSGAAGGAGGSGYIQIIPHFN